MEENVVRTSNHKQMKSLAFLMLIIKYHCCQFKSICKALLQLLLTKITYVHDNPKLRGGIECVNKKEQAQYTRQDERQSSNKSINQTGTYVVENIN